MDTTKPKILIIIASTREGRRGEGIAKWAFGEAEKREDLDFELVDLKKWNLPFFVSKVEPGDADYKPEGIVAKWSEKIASADGFIIVTPEYNHGYPATIKNALDHLYHEWVKKPIAFVSYGGGAGGARAVEQLRQVVIDFEMMPIPAAVHIVGVKKATDEEGAPNEERYAKSLASLFKNLSWWANVLQDARIKL